MTTRKPAPKRKAWKRWSVEHIDYEGDFIRFDGEHVDHEEVVKLLNRRRVTRERRRASAGRRAKKGAKDHE